MRNVDVSNHRLEQRNAHSLHAGLGSRCHWWQERSWFPRDPSGGSSSSGVGVQFGEAIKVPSSWPWWVSRESNQSLQAGGGLRVKVNLLIFKDEKTKDAVTYHSWQWDVAIFCHSGWDDQYSLPCIFQLLQEFLGDLASLGEDAIRGECGQIWHHLSSRSRFSSQSTQEGSNQSM